MTNSLMTRTQNSKLPVFAAIGGGIALILTAIGTYWDPFGKDNGSSDGSEWVFFNVPVILVATALIFGLVVRGAEQGNPGRRAAILGVLGLVSVVGFWTGLPTVFAVAGVACAVAEQDTHGRFGNGAKAALALAPVTGALAIWLALAG